MKIKRGNTMNLIEIENKEEYIYFIYFKEHKKNKTYKKKLSKYISLIKENLKEPEKLKLFIYEELSKKEKEIIFNINVFPLLVIKEKNKEKEYITGIRKI